MRHLAVVGTWIWLATLLLAQVVTAAPDIGVPSDRAAIVAASADHKALPPHHNLVAARVCPTLPEAADGSDGQIGALRTRPGSERHVLAQGLLCPDSCAAPRAQQLHSVKFDACGPPRIVSLT